MFPRLRKFFRLSPDDAPIATKGKTEAELRDEIKTLDATIARAPGESALYCQRGYLYVQLEEFDKALADYDVAVSLLPGSSNFVDRGCAHLAAGNLKFAIEDFDSAIAADPKSSMAYSNRAAAYSNMGDIQRALEDYGRAIDRDPKYPNSYSNRAFAYYKLGEYEKGIADCNTALKLRPNHSPTYSNRGLCRAALGDTKGAKADFTRALELPSNPITIEEARAGLHALEK
jgi:tetratricopeptide (TPR) repeat protein